MISRVIEFSIRNPLAIFVGVAAIAVWGVYCLFRTPIDAIPDLSENQVIVWADWPGRSPQEIEDQITYPLSVNLQGLAGVKAVRATSEFGFSMVNIIFDDSTGFYFARERVLEKLSAAASLLPSGVTPYLAPDATALGQIFWYTVEGEGKSLDELRAIQDWYLRYALKVEGVAEVASAGGFVREYQIDVNPAKLRAFDIGLGEVFRAVMASNSSAGGKVLEKDGAEYLIRARGWLRGLDDLRNVVVAERRGVPITAGELGEVHLGPAFRRGLLEKGGGEAVGGVAVMRYGENPLEVTRRIKERIRQIQPGLEKEGVRIVPFYERTGLIEAAIDTLRRTLIEEIIIASLVVLIVLWHFRSAIVICVTLPLAVLISFILMYLLEIPSNIMSLAGIAISIGVLVDAGIVMTENAYNRLHERFGGGRVTGDTRQVVADACKLVGAPLFLSIVIMLVSFAPIFVLGGMEGRMFRPLAYTKTFALLGVALLAVTLVPAMIPLFIRGRLRSQQEVWAVRSVLDIYRPMLSFFMRHPDVIVVITGTFLLLGLPIFPRKVPWIFFVAGVPFLVAFTAMLAAKRKLLCFALLFLVALGGFRLLEPLGEEFMPPLDELAILDMPITTPNAGITRVAADIRLRDAVLAGFPEVHQVVGKGGRAETPTDPAPVDMLETVVSLRPRSWWPKRKVKYEVALAEAGAVVRELIERGILIPGDEADLASFANGTAMEALARFDRLLRELSMLRLAEAVPETGRELIRLLREELVRRLRAEGALKEEIRDEAWGEIEERLVSEYARRFDEWILLEDVTSAAGRLLDFLVAERAVGARQGLLRDEPSLLEGVLEPLRALAGRERPALFEKLRAKLEARHDALRRTRARELSWEIADRAPGDLVWCLIEEALENAPRSSFSLRAPSAEELQALRAVREAAFGRGLLLWRKEKRDLVEEMGSELQVPGWGNIFTQPIINRVDMLATGVRTPIGVKVFGDDLETIQKLAGDIAAVLRKVRGAENVVADQIVGENYIEIEIDRPRAARYGVNVEDVQEVVEVALGGKEITTTVEGRQRFPVRVRYAADWRADVEMLGSILVPARPAAGPAMGPGSASGVPMARLETEGARLLQVPLSSVAAVKLISGPSMIKSENGLLRAYVQLGVRDRDIVGFVEEARRAVEAEIAMPPGYYLEWSGQFEHQVRAKKTLTLVLPMVILIIFLVLYITYRDVADTLLMFLAVPGAVAGGALFQYLFGYDFSVAVWVGYIACFGLATETGIIMLVYLREAIARRGGLERIRSEEEIREAVMEGAVHRLRPKLLTEGTTILALIPMLWATGAGAEFLRPMAAPILGGVLVADEVIDILIPVLFYKERCRRWRRLRGESPEG